MKFIDDEGTFDVKAKAATLVIADLDPLVMET